MLDLGLMSDFTLMLDFSLVFDLTTMKNLSGVYLGSFPTRFDKFRCVLTPLSYERLSDWRGLVS